MWTDSARAKYARAARRYATDLSEAEFALVAPHLPPPCRLGRPRTTDLRAVLDAIFYLLRTGCQWRLLPKCFPPRSTVFGYFRRWWRDGTKVVKHKAEEGRVAVRKVRRAARHDLEALERDHNLSGDELERAEKELEKLTHEYVAEIDRMVQHKEQELIEV